MVSREQIEIRRTGNVLDAERLQLLLGGVESWAVGQVLRDSAAGASDHLGEDWAKPLPPTATDGGTVSGSIEDMQSRFNLNNLVAGGQVNAVAIKRFERLLRLLDIDTSLTGALADWMDPDSEPQFPNGAEDEVYLRRDPPYLAANRALTSIDELLLIEGVTREIFERLRPYVCALPPGTSLNVNTAPRLLLRTLADKLDQQDVETLDETRKLQPFDNVTSFLQQDALSGLGIEPEGLDVATGYFAVHALAAFSGSELKMTSLIARASPTDVGVLYRYREAW